MIAGKLLKTTAKWRLGAALLAAVAGLIPSALAQSNAPAKSTQPQSERFLIVFETSRGMARRAENSIKTVSNLISSGLNGQMQTGDTLGLWTFNDTLSAGKFPLANWWSENSPKIAEAACVFLRQQKFEKGADFKQVTVMLNKVAEASDRLTVIIVSSGENDISGTQCDEEINHSFKAWRSEQQKARMPIVSVIRASRAEFIGHAITPAPWQAEVPPWPKRLLAAAPARAAKTNTVTKPKAAPAQAEVKSTQPPVTITTNANALIFTGKKSNAGTAITTAGAQTNQVDPPAPLRAAASDNAATSEGPLQSPVFISAAAITNLTANAQPAPAPAPTGNANATPSDTGQSSFALQVHARTLQDAPATATNNVAPSNKTAQTAAALPPPTILMRKFVLAVGLGLTAMIGLFLFLRGGGNVRQESLITRSYQRKRK